MSDIDRQYFERRLEQERDRGETAPSPEARHVHQQLANRYAARLGPADADAETRPRLHLAS